MVGCDCSGGVQALLLAHGIAKTTRVRLGDVLAIHGLLSACAREASGSIAGFHVDGAAALLRLKPYRVILVLDALETEGVICDGEMLLPSQTSRGTRRQPQTGAERTRAYRARRKKAAEILADGHASDITEPVAVTSSPSEPEVLSLFPVDALQVDQGEKEHKPHAREPDIDDGFAELVAIWPKPYRIADAEREYRRYLKRHTPENIREAAQRYVEGLTTEPWRGIRNLANWLKADPCRDPALPLQGKPQLVATSEPAELLDEPNERLRERIGATEHRQWFSKVEVLEHGGGKLRLGVTSGFARSYLLQHFEQAILSAWRVREVDIIVTHPDRRTA